MATPDCACMRCNSFIVICSGAPCTTSFLKLGKQLVVPTAALSTVVDPAVIITSVRCRHVATGIRLGRRTGVIGGVEAAEVVRCP